jgi:Spy/CpxP family protein refolding chaperone
MPKKLLIYFLGLMLAGMASAPLALAQPAGVFQGGGPGPGPGPAPGGGGGGGFQGRFLQVKRQQMGPALGVNQQTVDRLLEIERRYQPGRRQLIQSMRMDYQRLQQVMSQGAPAEGEVAAILGDMKRKKQEMQDLQTRQGEEEDALLTPVQQARFLMYNQSLMREARDVMRAGPREGGPLTPGGPPEVPVINPSGR